MYMNKNSGKIFISDEPLLSTSTKEKDTQSMRSQATASILNRSSEIWNHKEINSSVIEEEHEISKMANNVVEESYRFMYIYRFYTY